VASSGKTTVTIGVVVFHSSEPKMEPGTPQIQTMELAMAPRGCRCV